MTNDPLHPFARWLADGVALWLAVIGLLAVASVGILGSYVIMRGP